MAAFETSLQRLTASMARVTNADAVLDGAPDPVRVVFDNGYAVAFDAMAVRHPRVGLAESDAGAVDVDSTVEIVDGSTYTVQTVEPDGAGWVELTLRLAA